MPQNNTSQKIRLLMQNRDPAVWTGGDSIMVEKLSENLNKLGIHTQKNYSFFPNTDNYDIFMSWNMNFPWTIFHCINAKANQKPFILFTMNFSVGENKETQRFLIDNADALIMFSKKEKLSIEKFLNINISKYKIFYFNQAVDKKFYIPISDKQKRNGIICPASIEPRKNQLNLIKACIKLKYPLTLVGKVLDENYFNECLDISRNHTNISFLNHVNQTELKTLYSKSKVVALISQLEPWSLSHLEGGLTGCNIVTTTNTYGNDSLVLPNCWDCNPNSLEEIFQTIQKAYTTPLSVYLQNKILNEYSWPKRTKDIIPAINYAIKNNRNKKFNYKTAFEIIYNQINAFEINNNVLQNKNVNLQKQINQYEENRNLNNKFQTLQTDIFNIEHSLLKIRSSKFFKTWQLFTKFKKIFK